MFIHFMLISLLYFVLFTFLVSHSVVNGAQREAPALARVRESFKVQLSQADNSDENHQFFRRFVDSQFGHNHHDTDTDIDDQNHFVLRSSIQFGLPPLVQGQGSCQSQTSLIYLLDSAANLIYEYNAGQNTYYSLSPGSLLTKPAYCSFAPDLQTLFLTSSASNQIFALNVRTDQLTILAGVSWASSLSGLAYDQSRGLIWVTTSSSNGGLLTVSGFGQAQLVASLRCSDVTIDLNNNVFFASSNKIYQMTGSNFELFYNSSGGTFVSLNAFPFHYSGIFVGSLLGDEQSGNAFFILNATDSNSNSFIMTYLASGVANPFGTFISADWSLWGINSNDPRYPPLVIYGPSIQLDPMYNPIWATFGVPLSCRLQAFNSFQCFAVLRVLTSSPVVFNLKVETLAINQPNTNAAAGLQAGVEIQVECNGYWFNQTFPGSSSPQYFSISTKNPNAQSCFTEAHQFQFLVLNAPSQYHEQVEVLLTPLTEAS